MRNYFFLGGGREREREIERERERGRERERERNIVGTINFFKYSLGKKRQCSDPFQPQSKDLEFLTVARKNVFFFKLCRNVS